MNSLTTNRSCHQRRHFYLVSSNVAKYEENRRVSGSVMPLPFTLYMNKIFSLNLIPDLNRNNIQILTLIQSDLKLITKRGQYHFLRGPSSNASWWNLKCALCGREWVFVDLKSTPQTDAMLLFWLKLLKPTSSPFIYYWLLLLNALL